MVWFKVDDKHHDHRKTRRALRGGDKRRDAAAIGLWCLAGSWSADNLMDGFVPSDEMLRWDDDSEDLAARLVDAELWLPAARDGEPGFQFVNWDEHQPTKADVEAKREAARERMRSVRAKGGRGSREVRTNEQANFARSSDDVRSTPSRPVPTRPVPTPEATASGEDAAVAAKKPSRATQRPVDFRPTQAHVDLAAERGIDLRAEWAKFCDWCDATGKTYKDWNAALRTWIRNARPAQQVGSQPTRGQQHLALARQLAEEESGQMIPFPQIGGGR